MTLKTLVHVPEPENLSDSITTFGVFRQLKRGRREDSKNAFFSEIPVYDSHPIRTEEDKQSKSTRGDFTQRPGTVQRRRVHFAKTLCTVVCEIKCRSDYTLEEKNDLFLTASDLHQCRNNARLLSRFYRNQDRQVILDLDQVYSQAMSACRGQHHDFDEESFQRFMGNDSNQIWQCAEPLFYWCLQSKTEPGRGLERYCSLWQREERTAFTANCRQAIIALSRQRRQEIGNVDTPCICDPVAFIYQQNYSRNAAIYARIMGCADEIAAKELTGYDCEMAHTTTLEQL